MAWQGVAWRGRARLGKARNPSGGLSTKRQKNKGIATKTAGEKEKCNTKQQQKLAKRL